MGAVFFLGFLVIIFIIGLPIEIVSIIFLIKNIKKIKSKKQYNKILFCITIVGTIIGFSFIMPLIVFMIFIFGANILNKLL